MPDLGLENVTPNIFTTTKLRGCNPSFVTTSDGVVVIDTPQLPTRAVAMRAAAEARGAPRHRPEAAPIAPARETSVADPNKGTIVFTGDLTLRVGDHTFNVLHTPGHTPGQVAVHVPEERAVFTGDTIFSECQTWLMTSNVDQWLEALERIRQLDVDHLIPGHGPVTTLKYVDTQRAMLLDWKSAVADAVARGGTREETIARVRFDERYPVDVGQGYMMDHIQTLNAASLWDKFTALGYAKGR